MITKLPLPPTTNDAVNFDERADEFLSALPKFGEEANALIKNANDLSMAIEEASANFNKNNRVFLDKNSEFEQNFTDFNSKLEAFTQTYQSFLLKNSELANFYEELKAFKQRLQGLLDNELSSSDVLKINERIERIKTSLKTQIDNKLEVSLKNSPNGYAGLDEHGKISNEFFPDEILRKTKKRRLDFIKDKWFLSEDREHQYSYISSGLKLFEFDENNNILGEWRTNRIKENRVIWIYNPNLNTIPIIFYSDIFVYAGERNVLINKNKNGYFSYIPEKNKFDKNIKDLYLSKNNGSNAFLILEDGTLWCMGSNSRGSLGLGTEVAVSSFTKNSFFDDKEILDICYGGSSTYVFCKNQDINELYFFGWRRQQNELSPRLIDSNVSKIVFNHKESYRLFYTKEGKVYTNYSYLPPKLQELYSASEDSFVALKKFSGEVFEGVKDIFAGTELTLLLLENSELWVAIKNDRLVLSNNLETSNTININKNMGFRLFINNIKEIKKLDSSNNYCFLISNDNEVYFIYDGEYLEYSYSREPINKLRYFVNKNLPIYSKREDRYVDIHQLKSMKSIYPQRVINSDEYIFIGEDYYEKVKIKDNRLFYKYEDYDDKGYSLPYLGD